MRGSALNDPEVLVVYKKSSFLSGRKDVPAVFRAQRFRGNHLKHYASVKAVEAALGKNGVRYRKLCRAKSIDYRSFDLVVSVGGDGTFLQCAGHLTPRQLILGVNSDPAWSVGQFCATDSGKFEAMLLKILSGRYRVKRLYRMRVCTGGPRPRTFYALNDILIVHVNPAAMSRYALKVNGVTEEQRSSGVWFSTAAGSTGAILSAGGERMPLESRSVQYRPRELYQARTTCRLTGKVLAQGTTVEVVSHMTRGAIFVDGAHVRVPFPYGQKVRISSSGEFVSVIYA